MEKSAAGGFVRWEEAQVSSVKGRREVHYYLKRRDGTADLAVVGKEKSLRHMSYRYAIRNRSLIPISPSSSPVKLRSRREVIDWLNYIISDSTSHESSVPPTCPMAVTYGSESDANKYKDSQLRKPGNYTKEFLWLGSAWTCRKSRKHYESFRRNGVIISVHDFVFVLAEEDKRLIAYLEDMYEDPRGNKMVSVRWFHKIDEVGIVLPHNFNDREIFFSLCLQDLNVECIDGLATVLSPQHFEKLLNEATQSTHTRLKPFMCRGQYENDDVKPFDITQVQGYWRQEILRHHKYIASTSNASVKPLPFDDGLKLDGNSNNTFGIRTRSRYLRSRDDDVSLQQGGKRKMRDATYAGGSEKGSTKSSPLPAALSSKDQIEQNPLHYLTVGAQVEVLCQDSGIRGCWYRATIIKKHHDKVKVRYQDIQDADDEANSLEEWLLASRIAATDGLGLRFWGRKTVRPSPPQLNKLRVSRVMDAGSVVDVWWHDGWWEGIVIQKESEDKFHIYFPGEKQKSIFARSDLRHSQEWLGNSWEYVRERPDVATSLFSDLEEEANQGLDERVDHKPSAVAIRDHGRVSGNARKENLSVKDVERYNSFHPEAADDDKGVKSGVVPDISKDGSLAQLKWNATRKRKSRSGSFVQKPNSRIKSSARKRREVVGPRSYEGFFITTPLKVDHDNCKYMGDSLFSSSVVPPLTSLVMSR